MQCIRSKVLRSAQQATLTTSRAFSGRNVPRPAKLLPMMHLAAGARCPTSVQRRAFAMASRPALPELKGLQIEVVNETPSAKRFTQRGDTIDVHYKGTLTNGDKFDASYDRGQPLSFTVGKGQVIKGWDEGLLNMAVGDKRKLTIAPEIAYGQRAMGPIPAGSTLIFETELVSIKGVSKDEL